MRLDSLERILSKAKAAVETLLAADPDNPDLLHSKAAMLIEFGDVYANSNAGDGARALAAYEEGLEIRRRLAATDPGNTGWQRDVSVSLDRIGDLRLRAGETAAALAAYEEGLEIARTLAATDPGNTGWQRDVSVSLDRIGDLRLRAGETAAALAAYEEGLEIARTLAATDPGNTGWQTDVVVSLYKLSSLVDAPESIVTLEEALAILAPLIERGVLSAEQQGWPDILRERIEELRAANADGAD